MASSINTKAISLISCGILGGFIISFHFCRRTWISSYSAPLLLRIHVLVVCLSGISTCEEEQDSQWPHFLYLVIRKALDRLPQDASFVDDILIQETEAEGQPSHDADDDPAPDTAAVPDIMVNAIRTSSPP